MDWQYYKKLNTNIEGARASFEKDCASLFNAVYPDNNVKTVKVSTGDGGIDVFIGEIGLEPVTIVQCKCFIDEFGDSQKQQIRNSFKTAITSRDYAIEKWILCIPLELTKDQHLWWSKWKKDMQTKYALKDDAIELKDGNDLIDLFKKHNLYNQVFKNIDSLAIERIESKVEDLKKEKEINFEIAIQEINHANFYLENLVDTFGENENTHLERTETNQIFNWITKDLAKERKNIFILQGEKGYGKSVVMKNLLSKLKEEKITTLGIKADKYYGNNRLELEYNIFQKENISLLDIARLYNEKGLKLVILIDQLDALSQTLSSNRIYIHTYNRLIADLSAFNNIRIIISTRSYDLNYDADLSIYKSDKYSKVVINPISKEQVKNVLAKYHINNYSENLLDLLIIPNHLNIFCRLPKKTNLDHLKTLKDLYDSLWLQLITSTNNYKLSSILYRISDTMYRNQQITIANIYNDEFATELNYLKSNHLLIDNNNELQFFHQTFYEYTFSKQFVENNFSLTEYILENKQSLYIRSVTKMTLDYYRDYNNDVFCSLVKELIKSSKYRFHIKSLVITSFGSINKPTENEKSIVSNLLLKDFNYTKIFLNSVYSKGWIQFLLKMNLPFEYLNFNRNWKFNFYQKLVDKKIIKPDLYTKYNFIKQRDLRINLVYRLFLNNNENCLIEILEYFHKLPDSQEKTNLINHFLIRIDNWENDKLLILFDTYFEFNLEGGKRDNFWYYQILEKIFHNYPDYVLDKLKPIIFKIFEEKSTSKTLEHDHESLFDKIHEGNPDLVFKFFYSIFTELVENSKDDFISKEIDSSLYKSYKFTKLIESETEKYADDYVVSLLSKHIESKANDRLYFKTFYEETKKHDSIHHLKILTLGLNENPTIYKDEIFEFIQIIFSKNGFNGYDDKFQLYLRNLISKSFSLFSNEEKNVITDILLSIKHPMDMYYYEDNGKRKVALNLYSKKKYLFIASLPKNEIYSILKLKKVFQELERKFGILKTKQLDRSKISIRGVSAPLTPKAYDKMDHSDWIKSIIKFGDNYKEDWYNSKGGKLEHSRAFEEEVFKYPEKFYPLITELFKTDGISKDYLIAGVEGLVKANFEADKIKYLYSKLIKVKLDLGNTIRLIWLTKYLIQTKSISEEILNYLCDLALNHENPDSERILNDPLTDSLNTVRGAAFHKLIHCYYDTKFLDKIFNTVEAGITDSSLTVRVAILTNLAYLNYLDKNKAFELFLKMTNTDDLNLLKNAFRTASYFNSEFHSRMIPLIEKVIENEDLHDNGTYLIVHSWILGYDKNEKYYNKLINCSKKAKLKAIKVAEANLFKDGTMNNKCLSILFSFLTEKDEDFAHLYSALALRKFKPENFNVLFPFMKKYSKSNLFKMNPRYFLQYLLKCVQDYPKECLELISYMDFDKEIGIQNRGHYDSEPVQLILAIYSSLNNNFHTDKRFIERSLTIFDNMLKKDHLRNNSNKVIESIKSL